MRGFWLKLGSCRRAVAVTLMGTASNMFGSRQIEKAAAAADGRLGAQRSQPNCSSPTPTRRNPQRQHHIRVEGEEL